MKYYACRSPHRCHIVFSRWQQTWVRRFLVMPCDERVVHGTLRWILLEPPNRILAKSACANGKWSSTYVVGSLVGQVPMTTYTLRGCSRFLRYQLLDKSVEIFTFSLYLQSLIIYPWSFFPTSLPSALVIHPNTRVFNVAQGLLFSILDHGHLRIWEFVAREAHTVL